MSSGEPAKALLRLKTSSRTAKILVTCNEFVDIHEIVI